MTSSIFNSSLRLPPLQGYFGIGIGGLLDAHLAQLRLGTTGDLLGAQSHELLLELIELLLEILLVLAPKLLGSDLAGRLSNPPVSISSSFQMYAGGRSLPL